MIATVWIYNPPKFSQGMTNDVGLLWFSVGDIVPRFTMRVALHLEAGPIRCVRGLKSSLVIGQKVGIGPNPFTPRGRADLVVW
jgi:hypothetical protein